MPRALLVATFLVLFVAAPAVARPAQAPLSPATRAAIDAAAAKALTRSPGLSIMVMRDGHIWFSGSYGVADLASGAKVTPDTAFRFASVTKPVTAAVVLKLTESGKLSLDDKLARYVPELPYADQVTLYQLLTHTAGVPEFTTHRSYPEHMSRPHSQDEMISWIASLQPKLDFAPGSAWRYSNSGYVLLGVVVSRVTGRPLQSAYSDLVFRPAGVRDIAFEATSKPVRARAHGYRRAKSDPSGYAPALPISMTIPGAAGGLRGRAHGLAAWLQAVFDGKVLKAPELAQFTAPGRLADGRDTRLGMPLDWQEGLKASYGLGLFHDTYAGRRRLWHGGEIDGFNSWMAHYPDEDLTIVVLRNSEAGDTQVREIQDAVLADPAMMR